MDSYNINIYTIYDGIDIIRIINQELGILKKRIEYLISLYNVLKESL
jgi:hypothetical protein